jgi:phosphoribosyl 1,2-cyclic phosphodiesterase
MIAFSLQSGSNGNSIYVEANGMRLLFDAGISGIQAEKRLESRGIDIRDVDALLISHDHNDHARAAGIFHRKYGLPVYMTPTTYQAAEYHTGLGSIDDINHFEAGEVLDFGPIAVVTIPTPHDASDGAAFVVEANGLSLGVLTDLGHVFDGLGDVISSLDAVFLESNYDPNMLETGPYPQYLKNRIRGPGGHISNVESAELIASRGSKLRWACLSHLSEQNNSPDLALATCREIACNGIELAVAGRYGVGDVLEVG